MSDRWTNCRIGITGANGTLGRALTRQLRAKGAVLIGLTHGPPPPDQPANEGPHEWVRWQCGQETALDSMLASLDVLVINHGINPQGRQTPQDLNTALEVNALSSWRMMERFESLALEAKPGQRPREIWVNTSEAEIQPALSPAYELSKRLIGQLVSLRSNNLSNDQRKALRIRKLVLGPFRSDLNPIGLMSADLVANQVICQAALGLRLIIVTPNPLTYLLMPLTELWRTLYSRLLRVEPKNS
ncbi:MAG: SDR family oxidoreductase [Prochlorococcaceae cyanobacterium ETNP18_MAG_1]|nr:SDR family oxidoreductase [Prochlorococcaceae cyanobacterium ETNP18_MAG_1]